MGDSDKWENVRADSQLVAAVRRDIPMPQSRDTYAARHEQAATTAQPPPPPAKK